MQKTGGATRRLGMALAAFALAAFALVCVPECAHAGTIETVHLKGTVHQTEARSMLAMVNKFRTTPITDHSPDQPWYWDDDDVNKVDRTGLKPLKWSAKLEKMAIQRAEEALVRYDHERPDGTMCWAIGPEGDAGFSGENLAWGYQNANDAYLGWREDNEKSAGQGHRMNMLQNAESIGIAYVQDENGLGAWAMEIGWDDSTDPLPAPVDTSFDFDCDVNTDLVGSFKSNDKMTIRVGESVDAPASLSFSFEMKDYWGSSQYGSPVSKAIAPSSWKVDTAGQKIASISDGKIKGLSAGTTCIKTVILGHEFSYPVTVTRWSANLSLPKTKTVTVGSPYKLDVNKDTDGKLTFESSNPSVAKVTPDGVISTVTPGKATITVKAAQTDTYESDTTSLELTVRAESTPLTMDVPDTLVVGENGAFDYECPSSSHIKWTTSDSSVLRLSDNYYDARKTGTVTITASVADTDCWPAATTSKTVKVVARASDADRPVRKECNPFVVGAPSSMKVGESVNLRNMVMNQCHQYPNEWTSSNTGVLKVENGRVTAFSPGKATITCRCPATGEYLAGEASFEVTVTSGSSAKPAVTPAKPAAKPTAPKVSSPKGTTLTKVSKAKKAFKAKWRKASGVKGYQLRWSAKSNMAGAKSTTVRSAKTTSKKVSKLKKRTRYYVQVRTYKVVKGKTYWSGWSKAKSVRTK